jgi:hypothetical protein
LARRPYTADGWIYVARYRDNPSIFKIGRSADPNNRILTQNLEEIISFPVADMREMEKEILKETQRWAAGTEARTVEDRRFRSAEQAVQVVQEIVTGSASPYIDQLVSVQREAYRKSIEAEHLAHGLTPTCLAFARVGLHLNGS